MVRSAASESIITEAHGAAGSVVPLAVLESWSSFSTLLLEPLPQKVPLDRLDLIAPGPEAEDDPPFRFASVPGAYYSERNGWRLQIFGTGGGGKLLPGNDDFGSTSISSSFNIGLKLDVAIDDNSRVGLFGRLAEQNIQTAAHNDFHSGRATSQQIGGGLFAQLEKPDWFARAAIGWDAIDAGTRLQVRNDSARGDFRTWINRSGTAFNAALQGGLRWSLNSNHLLEPSVRLSGTWLDVSGGARHGYRIDNTATGLGSLDLGMTWKAPIRDGSRLFTPSLRVSWLHRDFLGATPGSNITFQGGPDIVRSSPEPQTNGLGLQGQLAYTFKDNTDVVVHGGANFYGADPIWSVGGRLQLRF